MRKILAEEEKVYNVLIWMQANQKNTPQSIKPTAACEIFALISVYFLIKVGFTEKGAYSRIFSGHTKKMRPSCSRSGHASTKSPVNRRRRARNLPMLCQPSLPSGLFLCPTSAPARDRANPGRGREVVRFGHCRGGSSEKSAFAECVSFWFAAA